MDIGINYRERQLRRGGARVPTNGQGVDLVVDSVGGKTLEGSLECASRYRGRVITVGNVSREGRAIDIGAERRQRLAHGRLLRPRDVPQRAARRRADG